MSFAPGVLARGPWRRDEIAASWLEEPYRAAPDAVAAADAAIVGLRDRGSPSYDGMSARVAGYRADGGRLALELQPARWALRLTHDPAARSLSALCVVRDADGRWLAGRRAPWVASWAGRWALGAGGAVEVGEHPADTLGRELAEEWSVTPARLTVQALVALPGGMVMLVGLAELTAGAEPVPDAEHDASAWWPADPARWPAEAGEPVRRMARALVG